MIPPDTGVGTPARLRVLRDALDLAIEAGAAGRADLIREYRMVLVALNEPDRRDRLARVRSLIETRFAEVGVGDAALVAQYRLVLADLDGLPEEGATAVVDEVRRAREARQAATAVGVDPPRTHPGRR